MKSVLLAVAAAMLAHPGVAAAAPAPAESAASQAHIRQIEGSLTPPVRIEGRPSAAQTLAQLMKAAQVPAVSIAFIDEGRVAWVRAYGQADIAAGRAATPGTLFQAGSISKPVAATAAMAMVQDGSLELDAPVNAALKSWKLPDNDFTRKTPVTLRMLLTHTGGLTVHGFEGYAPGKPVPSVVQVLDGAPPANSEPVRVDIAPMSEWRYSGGGYTIVQLLMSDVSGQSFPALIEKRVLAPFGMTASTYEQPLPAGRLQEAAVGYRAKAVPIEGLRNTYPEMAAAGLWTTPSDLARWVIAIQDAEAGRANPVLSQASARETLTPGMGHWGLGLSVTGEGRDRMFSHGGANEGFRNEMFGFPGRRQGVVVMTNSDDGEKVIRPLILAVAASYGWPGFEPKVITPAAVKPGELAVFAGRYALGKTEVQVRQTAGGRSLELVPPGSETYELIPQGGDSFVDAEDAMPAKFTRDAAGQVAGLEFAGVKLTRSRPASGDRP
jgi:CubicO group peptidase (beta-lactamase class C family)